MVGLEGLEGEDSEFAVDLEEESFLLVAGVKEEGSVLAAELMLAEGDSAEEVDLKEVGFALVVGLAEAGFELAVDFESVVGLEEEVGFELVEGLVMGGSES